MEIYITGMALGSITVLSITNSVIMPWMDGDWRKILWIYSSIVFLSGLIWLLISTHPESREMEVNLSKLERPPLKVRSFWHFPISCRYVLHC